tara:strand:- start:764 stop:1006 length:243 start_codon:yes stop_codon:yes gene_type:complete
MQYDKVIRNERETVKAPIKNRYWSLVNMGDPLAICHYIDQRIEDLKTDPDRGSVGELLALQKLIEASLDEMVEDLQKGRL